MLLESKRLGHANVSTKGDIYGHLLPEWLASYAAEDEHDWLLSFVIR